MDGKLEQTDDVDWDNKFWRELGEIIKRREQSKFPWPWFVEYCKIEGDTPEAEQRRAAILAKVSKERRLDEKYGA